MTGKNILQIARKKYNKKWKYILVTLPILFFYVLFSIYPNLKVFPMSFYDWSPISSIKTFVGWENYNLLFNIKRDLTVERLGNTLMYVAGLFVIQTILALVLALVLQKNTRKNTFFRAYFFLPMVFSTTMVSMIWAYMYDPNLGIINTILGVFGVEGYPGTDFFAQNAQAILCIVFVHIWANIGYPLTILVSGLNTISGDLGEAAKIDGANNWQTFKSITFPLLLPTLFRLSLLTVTTGTLASDYVVMIGTRTGSVPYETLASWMYKSTAYSTNYGMTSALGVIMFIILSIASLVQFVAIQKIENKILG
ncbi:MAG: sugar ABC transporter permease [Tyzzerella sp.]|nr:sugar ABC transporter permease [Tyzzerella sp.]